MARSGETSLPSLKCSDFCLLPPGFVLGAARALVLELLLTDFLSTSAWGAHFSPSHLSQSSCSMGLSGSRCPPDSSTAVRPRPSLLPDRRGAPGGQRCEQPTLRGLAPGSVAISGRTQFISDASSLKCTQRSEISIHH